MTDDSWRRQARCRGMDPNIFFPIGDELPLEARKVCARCPVSSECLSYALSLPRDTTEGVWGGTTKSNRKSIRRYRLDIKKEAS